MDLENRTDEDLIEEVEQALQKIHGVLVQKPDICKRLSFRLTSKKAEHKARQAKYKDWKGPDANTIQLLAANEEQWRQQPSLFWMMKNAHALECNDPEERIIHECIGLSLNDAHSIILRLLLSVVLSVLHQEGGSRDVLGIAHSVLAFHTYNYKAKDLAKVIDGLIDAGFRYRLIEAEIGQGALEVLGDELSPHYWENTLSKKGKIFDDCILHLKEKRIEDAARRYAKLHKALIDFKFGQLQSKLASREHRGGVLGKRRRCNEPAGELASDLAPGNMTDQAPSQLPQIADTTNMAGGPISRGTNVDQGREPDTSDGPEISQSTRSTQTSSSRGADAWQAPARNDGQDLWNSYLWNYPQDGDLWHGLGRDYHVDNFQIDLTSWAAPNDFIAPVQ